MPENLALALSLAGLAVTLAVAVARPRWPPEAVVAAAAAAGLVAVGAVTADRARQAVGHLAPTIGFLAALLLLADGCRRDGLFEALGALMARGSRERPRQLLALVFAMASSVTVVLGLDPTIVLLTPVVLATATRLRISPEPDVYATVYLANSASLLPDAVVRREGRAVMRVLVWIMEETWQATVAAAAIFLPADANVTLLHVTAGDTETVVRGARYALLGRSHRLATEALDEISEHGTRDLLADAHAALGREAVLDARSGRIEHEAVAAAGTADLIVLARDEDHAHRGPRSLGPAVRYVIDHAPCAVLLIWPNVPSG